MREGPSADSWQWSPAERPEGLWRGFCFEPGGEARRKGYSMSENSPSGFRSGLQVFAQDSLQGAVQVSVSGGKSEASLTKRDLPRRSGPRGGRKENPQCDL